MEKIALDPLLVVIPMLKMIPTDESIMILDILEITREQIPVADGRKRNTDLLQ